MAPPRTSWSITSQITNQTINDNAGNTIVGTYVNFTTGAGNQGAVFIPDATYNVANVTEVVRERAALIDQIGALSETVK